MAIILAQHRKTFLNAGVEFSFDRTALHTSFDLSFVLLALGSNIDSRSLKFE